MDIIFATYYLIPIMCGNSLNLITQRLNIKIFLFCSSSFRFKTDQWELGMLSCVITQGPRLMGAVCSVLLPSQHSSFTRWARELMENSASLLS